MMNIQSSVEYYNSVAKDFYSESIFRERYLNQIDNLVVNQIKYDEVVRWLDIGSGDARRTKKIHDKVASNGTILESVMIIEPSSVLYGVAMKNFAEANIYNKNFEDVVLENCNFTHVTALWNVLGHVEGRDFFLEKIYNCLCHKGKLIFDVNNRYNIAQYGMYNVLKNFFKDCFSFSDTGDFIIQNMENSTLVHIHSPSEIFSLLRRAGFGKISFRYVDYQSGKIVNRKTKGQMFVVAEKE